jgi:magnesium-transporting ATPase (P-type)
MSVVIRSGGLIKMYIKGADSIIKSRLAKDQVLNLDE